MTQERSSTWMNQNWRR